MMVDSVLPGAAAAAERPAFRHNAVMNGLDLNEALATAWLASGGWAVLGMRREISTLPYVIAEVDAECLNYWPKGEYSSLAGAEDWWARAYEVPAAECAAGDGV
ncbi:MAG: hypothetical protein JWO08_2357 [Verrucomicrobiaceae bacterium]|nr:hypothetical protein [Verrucomicrobiaceae bacterium]